MTNVLIVEDEIDIANMERDFLEGAGFNTFIAANSSDTRKILRSQKINAVILDITLPGEDGFSLCRKIRETTNIPIILSMDSGKDSDIVRGLGLGADGYLLKPLNGTILAAYIRAQLAVHSRIMNQKINKLSSEEILLIDRLQIHPKARQVIFADKDVPLTGKEFDLLYFLAKRPGEVFTKDHLFKKIWGLDPIGDPATVTVHINRLRKKLKKNSGRPYKNIETVWGTGYRFNIADKKD